MACMDPVYMGRKSKNNIVFRPDDLRSTYDEELLGNLVLEDKRACYKTNVGWSAGLHIKGSTEHPYRQPGQLRPWS